MQDNIKNEKKYILCKNLLLSFILISNSLTRRLIEAEIE